MKTKLERFFLLQVFLCTSLAIQTREQSCSSTAGPFTGATFSTQALSGSSFSWTNPSGAQTSDGSNATASFTLGILASAWSDYLVIKKFGFSIPTSATICEIIVELQRSAGGLGVGNSTTDNSVRLLKNGVLTGSDQASGNAWPSSDGFATYGNSLATGLWNSSWTPADVNDSNFGVAVSAVMNSGLVGVAMSAQINQIRVSIVYSNAVLGLDIQQYTATRTASGNLLQWITGSSSRTGDNFTVQRSADSHGWQDLTSMPALAGDDQSYSYTDSKPLSGINYYRLRLDEASGTTSYSTICAVQDGAAAPAFRCWPNPFKDRIFISGAQPLQKITLQDLQGRTLLMARPAAGTLEYQLPAQDLPAGIYLLQVDGYLQKLIKPEK